MTHTHVHAREPAQARREADRRALAIALALVAAGLAARPAKGAMTYGMGRAETLSAQINGAALLVLALLIVYEAIRRLLSPPDVPGAPLLAVAALGVAVNLAA